MKKGKQLILDGNKIRELYVNEGKSAKEIGMVFNVSGFPIYKILREQNIKRRKRGEGKKIDLNENELKRLYLGERKNIKQISEIFDINRSTIGNRLKKLKKIKREKNLEKVKDLYVNQKKSVVEIANILGISNCSVYRVLDSLGIKRSIRIDLDMNKIKDLYVNQGKTTREIGKIFNVDKSLILYRLNEEKVKIRNGNVKVFDLEKVKELYVNKKKSTKEIARIFRVSTGTIFIIFKKLNIHLRKYVKKRKELDLSKIKRLYLNEKKSATEISKIFGVSHYIISNRLKEMGIKRDKSLNFNQIKRLYVDEKESSVEIGRIFGFCGGTIIKRLKEVGIKIRNWDDPWYKEKHIKDLLQGTIKKPSSYEKKISDLCIENNLPFIYTGNGTFLIGSKNPDFINKEKRIAIEVFNNYHKIQEYGSVENYIKVRGKYFAQYGYNTIFIREEEITHKNWENICLNKIQEGLR